MPAKFILLVEDNPSDVLLARRALKNNIENELVVAHDGVECSIISWAWLPHADRDLSIQPQVVWLDLKLPRVDGLRCCVACGPTSARGICPS